MEKEPEINQSARILLLPTWQEYHTRCCVCGTIGKFEAFRIYEESLAKAYFYCNDCKHYHEKGHNIDIKDAPELSGVVAIPKGVIVWEKK